MKANKFKIFIILLSILLVISLSFNLVIGQLYIKTNIANQRYVSKESPILIKGISWRPFETAVKVNTPIKFVIIPNKYDINSLEFQLWEKNNDNDWKIKVPFSAWKFQQVKDNIWSPKENIFKNLGIVALQMDIRIKNQPLNVQQLWLGQFFVHNNDILGNSDTLLRELLAVHSPLTMNTNQVYESIAYPLNLAINMLYWQYSSKSVAEKLILLERLPGIKILDKSSLDKVKVKIEKNEMIRYINLTENTIDVTDITYTISLAQHPNIKTIFDKMRNFPKQVVTSAVLTYLISVNYNYSIIPAETEQIPLYSMIGHCASFSSDLFEILKLLEIPCRILEIHYAGDGLHVVCEILVNKKIYVLDPTIDVVYNGSLQEILKQKIDPVSLPQVRDLSFLKLGNLAKTFQYKHIFRKYGNW